MCNQLIPRKLPAGRTEFSYYRRLMNHILLDTTSHLDAGIILLGWHKRINMMSSFWRTEKWQIANGDYVRTIIDRFRI